MAKLSVFICSLYILVLTSYSMAMTEEQKKMILDQFHAAGMNCIKDNPVTADDITAIKTRQMPEGAGAPCFMACILKATGFMDDSGMLQHENALEQAKKVFNDPEELKKIENYLHSCAHINNEAVSDGDKGCDRAMLSYKCMMGNADQFGFDL